MIEAKVVHMTPEIALQWREKNTNNFRKLNLAKVGQYASDITSGNWALNGEAIEFYDDGTLANGQHRIEAVIRAGKAIDVLVVTGIDKKVAVYDIGSNRSAQQLAANMGLSVNNPRLAAASFIMNVGDHNTHGKIEVLEYYASLSEYFDQAYKYSNKGVNKQKILIKAGAIAAIYCSGVLNLMNDDKIEAFCTITNSGMPYSSYVMEPAIVLRNMILNGELGTTGTQFMNRCFNATWQAMVRFEKQVKNKTRYKVDEDLYKTIIPRANLITEMLKRTA